MRKRKRNKFKAVVAIALSMALMLGACGSQSAGAGASKDMIPLSEVIFSDEDLLIWTGGGGARDDYTGSTIDKKDIPYSFYRITPDGTRYIGQYRSEVTLGYVAQMSDEEILTDDLISWKDEGVPVSWNIITDGTGNNTSYISFDPGPNSRDIGNFLGHITIYDSSYMVFSYIKGGIPRAGAFYLIRDTKDTIDKTVYLDPPGTEGFTVDGK
ncbi:MAG: hypothetical protein PUA75_11400 [Clostridiales bacterium]|nr:hypothetical protein [Clostridiales bacterium]